MKFWKQMAWTKGNKLSKKCVFLIIPARDFLQVSPMLQAKSYPDMQIRSVAHMDVVDMKGTQCQFIQHSKTIGNSRRMFLKENKNINCQVFKIILF